MHPAALNALRDLAEEHALPPQAPAQLRGILRVLATDDTAPTTIREPVQAVDVHIRDALDGLRLPDVRDAREAADLGAGAGFPGLVLAVALPGATVRLVESAGRKCAFLRRLVAEVGLPNVEVVNARAEAWPEGIGRHDLVTARALAPLTVLAEYAAPLLRTGGTLVAWKGRVDDVEGADGRAGAEAVGLSEPRIVDVPPRPGADVRTLWVLRKEAETPARYPRRPGMARKRPITARG